ncbi:MAG: sporulation transcription factor Spo0A [Christensenellaceae bacterium]
MQTKLNTLILEDDEVIANKLKNYLNAKDEFLKVDCAYSVREANEFISMTNYDMLVLDIIMPACDGFGFLEMLSHQKKSPCTIMVSAVNNEAIIKKAFLMGAKYYMIKPYENEIMYRRILDVMRLNAVKTTDEFYTPTVSKNIEQRITDLFFALGIPPHLKGYQYLKEAVLLAMEDRMIIYSVTKKLYPAIAKNLNSTPTKVELSIRHAIEVTWERGKLRGGMQVLGFEMKNKKPTNSEFIALAADKLSLE